MSPEKVREVGALYAQFFRSSGVVGDRSHRNLSLEPASELVSKDPQTSDMAARKLITHWKITLESMKVIPEEFPHDELVKDSDWKRVRSHLAAMLPKMELFLAGVREDKVLRLLGFTAGVNVAMSMGRGDSYVYCAGIIGTVQHDAESGNMPVALYRLGFIQGVLWAGGAYSIQQLKQHNES